ncbi:hypothetical protein M9Y10_013008 [Tritrichomonas musculus]|uniref:Uncharacterized protein n=1 Tax=Tritrichomonas musculus TaxID=1915356 RepID=A0ABR2I5X1_9EUKA
MILFSLLFRHYVVQPWFLASGKSSRYLCRGWICGSSKDNVTEREYFIKVIKKFREEKLETSLYTALKDLIHNNYLPALCASGLFYLFNYDDFEYDVQKSFDILTKCANQGFWACHEHLAFHPLTKEENRRKHMIESAKSGSIICIRKIAKDLIEKKEYDRANELLYPILYSMSSNWLQQRRTGPAYAKDVKSIFLNDRHVTLSWKDLLKKSRDGNLAAAIWIANGFIVGKFKNITSKEVSSMLMKFTENGQWRFDVIDLFDSEDFFNRKEIIQYFARIGDPAALAVNSYSEFFDE